jgi:YegS/Rv2252/BmrU family lipid kinase
MEKINSQSSAQETQNSPKTFLVYNPVAGKEEEIDSLQMVKDSLEEAGHTYEVFEWHKENLKPVIQTALEKGFQHFIAMGGDGTFAGVANNLVFTGHPLAFIPNGSTNSMARALGIPLQLEKAIDLSIHGNHSITIDAIKAKENYFFLNVGVGFTAEAMQQTSREDKRKYAWRAYVRTGLERISKIRLQHFDLLIDDQLVKTRASEINIANLGLMGIEPFHWGKNVHPDDGILNVHLVRSKSTRDYLELFWNLIFHQAEKTASLSSFEIKQKITITSLKPIPVQGDGEVIGTTPVELTVIPQAIKIIVPKNSERNL